jgi:hypothetical protein
MFVNGPAANPRGTNLLAAHDCMSSASGLWEWAGEPMVPKRKLVDGMQVQVDTRASWLADGSGAFFVGKRQFQNAQGMPFTAKGVFLWVASSGEVRVLFTPASADENAEAVTTSPQLTDVVVQISRRNGAQTTNDLHLFSLQARTRTPLTTSGNNFDPCW